MKSIKCLGCGTIYEGAAVVGYLAHECKKPPEIEFEEALARLDNELEDLGLRPELARFDGDVNVFHYEHEDEDVLGYYEDDDEIAVELPPFLTRRTSTLVEIPIAVVAGVSLLAFYFADRAIDRVRRAIR